MKALAKEEIIEQLSRFGITSTYELDRYAKEYVAYFEQHNNSLADHFIIKFREQLYRTIDIFKYFSIQMLPKQAMRIINIAINL